MLDWSQPIELEDGVGVSVFIKSRHLYKEKERAFVAVPYSIKGKVEPGTWVYTEEGYFQGSGEPTSPGFDQYLRVRNVDDPDLYKEDLT